MTQALDLAAETHRVSKSAILELALQKFLAPAANGSSAVTNLSSQQLHSNKHRKSSAGADVRHLLRLHGL